LHGGEEKFQGRHQHDCSQARLSGFLASAIRLKLNSLLLPGGQPRKQQPEQNGSTDPDRWVPRNAMSQFSAEGQVVLEVRSLPRELATRSVEFSD